jgi:cholesterol oxidase
MKVAVGGPDDRTDAHATGVRFSEVMTGAISRRPQSAELPLESNTPLALHVTVIVSDLQQFLADPDHTATLAGWVDCPALGGRLPVERGTCNFFSRGEPGRGTELRYWMIFRDSGGSPLTLRGVKSLRTGAPGRVWADTTTLYVGLFGGCLGPVDSPGQESVAEGIVRIWPEAFARELTTFRSEGGSPGRRARALLQFFAFFIGGLWAAYVADT